MALSMANRLIEQAELAKTDPSIKKLTTKERRHVETYLMATENKSNTELAEMLGVSVRMITTDKQVIKKEMASQLKDIDLSAVIVDCQLLVSRQINDLEHSKARLQQGTAEYRKHCVDIAKVNSESVKMMQDLGWYPKNIGNMTIEKYNFKGNILDGGNPTTQMTIDADVKQLSEGSEDGEAAQIKVN